MKALRYLAALLSPLAFLSAPAHATDAVGAQTVSACGTPNNTPVVGNPYALTMDTTGKLCVNAAVTASVVGTTSNASSGVATSSTNLATVAYNYGFNGTTWDQLQVDGSKNLKVDIAASGASNISTNEAQINGVTPLMGNGVTGTGSQRVTIASDNTAFSVNSTLQAGSAKFGQAAIDQTTPGTTNAVQTIPGTSGGLLIKSFIVANNTTSVAVDASAGQVYAIAAYGVASATPVWLKLYNAAQGSTTCGSGTPVERHLIATASTGNGVVVPINSGEPYGTAITACVTAGIADNDTTAPAASSYIVNVYYK